jgi:hypothetical protein
MTISRRDAGAVRPVLGSGPLATLASRTAARRREIAGTHVDDPLRRTAQADTSATVRE